MTNANKAKGDAAERELAKLLADHLGYPCRRKLGAGRLDDTGDIDGIPDTVVQCANWSQVAQAVRLKPLGAERQRTHADATFAVTFIRLRGGDWRAVLTVEQMATWMREALS